MEPVERRSATPAYCARSPWAKAHGYRHGLALRGTPESALAPRMLCLAPSPGTRSARRGRRPVQPRRLRSPNLKLLLHEF